MCAIAPAGPGDRRVVRIVPTPRGTELIDSILSAHLANYARLLEPLDDTETDRLTDTLRRLLENIEGVPPEYRTSAIL